MDRQQDQREVPQHILHPVPRPPFVPPGALPRPDDFFERVWSNASIHLERFPVLGRVYLYQAMTTQELLERRLISQQFNNEIGHVLELSQSLSIFSDLADTVAYQSFLRFCCVDTYSQLRIDDGGTNGRMVLILSDLDEALRLGVPQLFRPNKLLLWFDPPPLVDLQGQQNPLVADLPYRLLQIYPHLEELFLFGYGHRRPEDTLERLIQATNLSTLHCLFLVNPAPHVWDPLEGCRVRQSRNARARNEAFDRGASIAEIDAIPLTEVIAEREVFVRQVCNENTPFDPREVLQRFIPGPPGWVHLNMCLNIFYARKERWSPQMLEPGAQQARPVQPVQRQQRDIPPGLGRGRGAPDAPGARGD